MILVIANGVCQSRIRWMQRDWKDLDVMMDGGTCVMRIMPWLTPTLAAPPSFLRCMYGHTEYKTFYHTFHQVMSPDRRAYSLKKHLLYCPLSIVDLACHLHVCRPQKAETTQCNVALLRLSKIHQPATRCYPIPRFSR